MPTTFSERLPTSLLRLSYFVPATIAFAAAAFIESPVSLVLLLFADALMMVATCRLLGFAQERGFFDDVLRGGLVYFALLAAYTALVAVLIGYPLAWLLREGSLSAALAVSGAGVIALIAVWRWWPSFGLIFVWKETHLHDGRRPRSIDTIKRSFALAWNMTDANDIFFSHGFPVALCLALLAQGALSLAGIEGPIPANFHIFVLAAYALVAAPLSHWLIVTRCADALLIELRRSRYDRAQEAIKATLPEPVEQVIEVMPDAGLSRVELNAMLLRCIRAGQIELALAALARGADPNFVPADERDQRPPLVLAAVSPDMRLLRGLIVKGGDLNHSHAGLTPLLAATRDSHEGRPDAVMTLLTNGADPRCSDAAGNTPLHYAALAARPIVAALLCDAEAPLEAINREGLTPLGVACAGANWELVRFLLERGAKIEVDHAQSALIAAASVDDDDVQGVKLLLKRRARADATGPLARTALMVAALNANETIAQALLDAGAQIDLVDAHGTTALMEAARSGAHAVLDVFAAYRPAVDVADALGRTALIIASQSKQASEHTVRQLLALGASPDLAAADGRRAVDCAAAAGRWNVVALLDPEYPRPASLAAGDDVPEPTAHTPAHLLDALRFAHWNIVDNFLEQVRTWSSTERTLLFTELADHADPAPRHWLLNNGVDATTDGSSLLGDALSRLPATTAAVVDLCAAGAQPAGTDALARICAAIPDAGDARAGLEALGLAMVERGAELFAPDNDGRTPLAHVVACGSGVLTLALLNRGVDPNARDRHGRTPLFGALQLPSVSALELSKALLGAGADPDAAAASGETPLGLALARPEPELQQWLNWPLWKLPQRRLRPQDLVAAAASGDVQAVDKLLALGMPIDAIDAQGASALLRAAGCGHAAVVEFLLGRGANSEQTAATGATALSAAVSARRDAVVETLLTHGVGADQRLPGGGTALMIAAALGYPEIVAHLLARGADVDAEDERGMRALHAAAQSAFQSRDAERARRTLELLLERGASVDARNGAGQTALLLLLGARAEPGAGADQRHLLALLPLLINRRADLNAQDKRGVSALHACAMHGLLLPARAVLAAGADPERRDILERTPRQIAHLLGFIDVAAEIGASSTTFSGAAQTLLQPARGFDTV